MSYPNKIKFGGNPDFQQNEMLGAVLQYATGSVSYSTPFGAFTTGQIFFSSGLNIPCYINNEGTVGPMAGNWSKIYGDTALLGQPLILSTNSSLTRDGNAIIDANLFFGSGIIPVAVGGTSASGLSADAVLIGNDTNQIKSTGLYYYVGSGSLGINTKNYVASINIGGTTNEVKPLWLVNKRTLLTFPVDNAMEYDGSGYYFTTDWGDRHRLVTADDSLNSLFTGILPMARGGTNNNTYTDGSLVMVSGTTFIGLVGSGNGCVPEWNGSKWQTSTTGYVTVGPTTSARNTIIAQNNATIPLTVRGVTSTGTAFRVQGSGGVTVYSVDTTGNMFFSTKLYPAPNNASSLPYISLVAVSGQVGPYIKMEGGVGVGTTRYSAGYIDTSADGGGVNASGGYINTAGGSSGPGGYIRTADGGGSLDTTGSGFLQLGSSFTNNRTTIIGGAATSNKTIRIPNQSGWFPVVNTPFTSGHYVRHNGSVFLLASGESASAGGITTLNGLTASTQTFSLTVSGTSLAIVSNVDDHKFIFPIASGDTVYAGLLSSGNWTTFNNKVGKTGYLMSAGSTGYTITHGFGTRDISVYVYENAGSYNQVFPTIQHATTSTVLIKFKAVTSIDHRAVIHG